MRPPLETPGARRPEWPDDFQPGSFGEAWHPVPLRHSLVKVRSRCNLAWVDEIAHGREPLPAGFESIKAVVPGVRGEMPGDMLDTLYSLRIQAGVSRDGGGEANDRLRTYADGSGRPRDAAAGIELRSSGERPGPYGGLPDTIDPGNSPVHVHEALPTHEPPAPDFLLPDADLTPPPGLTPGSAAPPLRNWRSRAAADLATAGV